MVIYTQEELKDSLKDTSDMIFDAANPAGRPIPVSERLLIMQSPLFASVFERVLSRRAVETQPKAKQIDELTTEPGA